MPNDHGQAGTALTPSQQFNAQLDRQVENFRALLPSHISVEKFKRVVIVAISQNPDLFNADRQSLFTEAQKCAADGLLPDGRQAALVVYGRKAVYMPMLAGIRQRMRNSGEVLSAEAHVVYSNDRFLQKMGDDPVIIHEPPTFGVDRGEPVGAYAIIKLKNGEILREVLDKKEIEKIRGASKSKDGPAWKNWWGEMARKSALRRCSKAAPTSADIDAILGRDDDSADRGMINVTPPREPQRSDFQEMEPEQDTRRRGYDVTDLDGEIHEFTDPRKAADAVRVVLSEASRLGPERLDAAWDNNEATIAEFAESLRAELCEEYNEMREAAVQKESPRTEDGRAAHEGDPRIAALHRLRGQHRIPQGEESPVDLLREAGFTDREIADSRRAREDGFRDNEPPERGDADDLEQNSGDAGAEAEGTASATTPEESEGEEEPRRTAAAEPQRRGPDQPREMSQSGKPRNAGEAGGSLAPTAGGERDGSRLIPVPHKRGTSHTGSASLDYRAWSVALFQPRLRRMTDSDELAWLLGDNAEALDACRSSGLSSPDLNALENEIAAAWDRCKVAA